MRSEVYFYDIPSKSPQIFKIARCQTVLIQGENSIVFFPLKEVVGKGFWRRFRASAKRSIKALLKSLGNPEHILPTRRLL